MATIHPDQRADSAAANGEAKPLALTYSQPDSRFKGPAYNYIRASDRLPTYPQIADVGDPACKVKLFLPGSRFTYYICAVTDYAGTLVLSGFCVSALEPSYDGFEDANLQEIAATRLMGLPIERDLHFTPSPLSEIKAALERGQTP
jgi:hypothetical protein